MVAQVPRIRRVSLYVVMLLISLLVIEAGFRAVLAFRVGPRVLLYGTSSQRQLMPATVPADQVASKHKNTQQGYTKFFPNEVKVHFDHTTKEPFKISINSRGFRGGEITEVKKPGITRIVTLGASSTFGYYDRDNETYPYYLEQKLNEDLPTKGKFESSISEFLTSVRKRYSHYFMRRRFPCTRMSSPSTKESTMLPEELRVSGRAKRRLKPKFKIRASDKDYRRSLR